MCRSTTATAAGCRQNAVGPDQSQPVGTAGWAVMTPIACQLMTEMAEVERAVVMPSLRN